MPDYQLRSTGLNDITELSAILAEGFADDPPMTWCFNGVAGIGPVMRVFSQRIYIPHGFASLCQQGNGATLWLKHNKGAPFDPMTMAQLAVVLAKYGGVTALHRSLRFAHFMDAQHPHEPHYYLFAIATRLAARGTGLGGALLRDGLSRADADGVGCYLENSKQQNLGFYQAHGFELMDKVYPVKGSPPIWRMWRPARLSV